MIRASYVVVLLLACSAVSPATDVDLFQAARVGDIARMKQVLSADRAALTRTNAEGMTALHVAAVAGQIEAIRLLLENDRDLLLLDKPTLDGLTPLYLAAQAGNAAIVRILLRNGANPERANKELQTPLRVAAAEGHAQVVRELLGHADPNAKDGRGMTALHLAVEMKHGDIVRLMVSNSSVDIRAVDNNKRTPLHLAVASGSDANARELVDAGALRNQPNSTRDTLLELACARVGVLGKGVKSPVRLNTTIRDGDATTMRQLLSAAPWLARTRDSLGWSPLHLAVKHNKLGIARLLLASGADTKLEDYEGRTPLDYAIPNPAMAKLLRSSPAAHKLRSGR